MGRQETFVGTLADSQVMKPQTVSWKNREPKPLALSQVGAIVMDRPCSHKPFVVRKNQSTIPSGVGVAEQCLPGGWGDRQSRVDQVPA